MELKPEAIYAMNSDLRTSNSDIILLDAATAILKAQRVQTSDITLNKLDILIEFYQFMSKLLVDSIGLEIYLVNEIVIRLIKQLSTSLNLDWHETIKMLLNNGLDLSKISSSEHVVAIMLVIQQLDINIEFDIPYLAGYSSVNPKKVYLDRGLKANDEVNQNMFYALAMHEFIEKMLMNKLGAMPYLYFRTHQIAQRVEKDVVESFGYQWNWYQDVLMAKEIERAYANIPQKIPFDLDYTPYVDCEDHDLIMRMKQVSQY